MARVKQEHLDARRQQILEAARRCFVVNGFHATSMQDILAEANLSSGGLYRYFRSKDEIIIAIARSELERLSEAFDRAMEESESQKPVDVLGRLFQTVEEFDSDSNLARMIVQAWSEALRSPAMAAQVREGFLKAIETVVQRIEDLQKSGSVDPDVDPGMIARALVGSLPGFMLQRALIGDINASSYQAAFEALLHWQHEI